MSESLQPCPRCAARDRDWWKPDPEDTFWMLEAEDGEWLKNEHSLLGTRDANKAIRFPTEQDAYNHPARMKAGSKWWSAKPTDHSWIDCTRATVEINDSMVERGARAIHEAQQEAMERITVEGSVYNQRELNSIAARACLTAALGPTT